MLNQQEEMVSKSNNFALRFFQEVYKHEKSEANFSVSPLSASWALSMAANGAAGETQTQLFDALGFQKEEVKTINVFQKALTESLMNSDTLTTLNIANSIWIKEGLEVKKSFINANLNYYDAQVETVPFNQSTLVAINNWCAQKTNNRIKNILDKVDGGTVMVLLNALYFKGSWTEPFKARATEDDTFTKEDATTLRVKMMHKKEGMRYMENDTLQMCSLPFGEGAFSMSFLLPKEGESLEEFARDLTPENWNSWNKQMYSQQVELSLPRFTAEYTVTLNGILQSLGAEDAFNPMKADFSGIVSKEKIYIDQVKQKTFVKVDENGAEAAAVTSVMMRVTSLPPMECPTMKLNRPFFYLIRENSTGTILFVGKMGEPKE